ncbi:MAG: SCO family protein [Bacteroidetes bacterium]|nr:SCO family protein [Bacteroidota bacterium]
MDKSLVYKTIGMILATVLPVVLFLYFRTNNGFQQNNMLPHAWWPISVDSIEENGKWKYDTVFHKIPHFKYVSSSGQIVTDSDMIGKISVVNFFFAQCPSICPIMNSNMANVIQSVSASNNLRVFLLQLTQIEILNRTCRIFQQV